MLAWGYETSIEQGYLQLRIAVVWGRWRGVLFFISFFPANRRLLGRSRCEDQGSSELSEER